MSGIVHRDPEDDSGFAVLCKNGRWARPAVEGEKILPCGCPLKSAPMDCVRAVASKVVTVDRRGLGDH